MTDAHDMTDGARERMRAEAVSITADLVAIDSTNTGDPSTIGDGASGAARAGAESTVSGASRAMIGR